MDFGGTDLEHTTLITSSRIIQSLLLQVLFAIQQGEVECQFEHRDMHWGNILVEQAETDYIVYDIFDGTEVQRVKMDTWGVKITIIDFTLSRMVGEDGVLYNDLEQDLELFDGVGESEGGDFQFDVYRMMRDELKKDWSRYSPRTNVLVYLMVYLVDSIPCW